MSLAINLIMIIFVFGLCITIHEFGHFITAKKSGIGVIEFSIGMGPLLWHTDKNGTQYSLRALPIGGYCAMVGEDEASDEPDAFGNAPLLNRIIVVVAGVCMNFILALIMSVIFVCLVGYNSNRVAVVSEDSAAYEAGIKEGDRVERFNGSRIYNFKEITVSMQFYKGEEPIELLLNRDGEKIKLSVMPKKLESGMYQMGIAGEREKSGNPLVVMGYAVIEVRYWIKTTIQSLYQLITGGVSVKQLSGPVGISATMNTVIEEAKETGQAINVVVNLINFCILLSANLGVMNLLPIPALDGGRLFFLLIELIFRKKLSDEVEGKINQAGMAFLYGLMALVLLMDISRLVFPKK